MHAAHEMQSSPLGTPSRLRRNLLWGSGLVLLLALLVLTPPLININRYRGRIAQAMSASLGRPVHLDNVSMHLLPIPGFTLQNFVVSENPVFGAEPTIRATSVEATLRLSSLWHRPLEFSRIHFDEPSVNLVRTPDGRWNLGDVLLHASHVDSAPTAQRRSGPAPRFPYVEATGGRINVKTGAEKLPFSLTDADFSLWLLSPQQWRMRLEAQPARTDTNITDPGKIRVEGELRRAAKADLVPVKFTGSWHDVPLGEATHIVAGDDLGWRGTLNLDATMEGTLGDAHLSTKLTLGGLRRADFFPAHTLDLQFTCLSGFAWHPVTLHDLECTLPDDAPLPLSLRSAQLTLSTLRTSPVEIQGVGIPAHWALLWAGLFSPRVQASQHPRATLAVHMTRGLSTASALTTSSVPPLHSSAGVQSEVPPAAWKGSVDLALPPVIRGGLRSRQGTLVWTVVPASVQEPHPSFRLAPTLLTTPDGSTVSLTGSISSTGYSVAVSGNALPALLLLPSRYLPQLGDGMADVLPEGPAPDPPARVQFTCTRAWNEEQSCTQGISSVSHPADLVLPTPR